MKRERKKHKTDREKGREQKKQERLGSRLMKHDLLQWLAPDW